MAERKKTVKKKVGLISLGCPKNLVDSEIMLGILSRAGYEIINDKEDADILIVNTCGFIESAKEESIDTILEMAECKKNKCGMLIVTGCLAERYKSELASAMPEVDAFIGTGGYDAIADVIERQSEGRIELFPDTCDLSYLNYVRKLSTTGYAYLKISEGCDNRCAYCAIPDIRGPYRSRRIEDIVQEAGKLAKEGRKEIILISQDSTRYGLDLYKKRSLADLVRKISSINKIEWIRLLYCYPEEIDDELIEEIRNNARVCKYMDIPVQHISDKILKAMGRRDTGRNIELLIEKLRKSVPGIVIRTSLIAGFPGEDKKDFRELCEFVKRTEFDRLGVFAYSREEGTRAAYMKGQIPEKVKQKRVDEIMTIQNSINERKNSERKGKKSRIIVDGITEEGLYYGRTYAEAPDIDWVIFFESRKKLKPGDFVTAEIKAIE